MNGNNFWAAVCVLFGAILIALIVEFAGGTVIDLVYNGLFDAGAFDDIPADWQSVEETNQAINLFHFSAIAIALTGIISFFVMIYREESSDSTEYYRY